MQRYTDADGPFEILVTRLYPVPFDGYRPRTDRMDVLPSTVEDAMMLIDGLHRWSEEDAANGIVGGKMIDAFFQPIGCPRPWTKRVKEAFDREMIRLSVEKAAEKAKRDGRPLDPAYVKHRLEEVRQLMNWRCV